MTDTSLPKYPPKGKIRYKAYYRDPGQNPFRGNDITVPTKTVDIDENVPLAEVEKLARDARENYEFDRVEKVAP